MILYFDTETNKYWLDGRGPADRAQATPVQVAMILDTPGGRTIAAHSSVLARRGWARRDLVRIEDRCVEKHGISEETCDAVGEPPVLVLTRFRWMLSLATLVVGHNVAFDVGTMDAAFAAMDLPPPAWPPQYCTMIGATPIVRKPAVGGRPGYGWPKLAEAYRYFSGRVLPGAHDALVDTQACRAVHRGIRRLEAERATSAPEETRRPAEPERSPASQE